MVTDHHALKWLLSLKDPRGRLARWMMEIQDFDFKVIYAPGKELVVPDVLSRDSFPAPLCTRCKQDIEGVEGFKLIEEQACLPTREEMLEAQKTEFGNLDDKVKDDNEKAKSYVINDEGLLCCIAWGRNANTSSLDIDE